MREFVFTYPDGTEADKARAMLARAEPAIAGLKDDKAWAQIDVATCTKTEFAFSGQVVEACEPLRRYLSAYPNGKHRTDAEQALAAGDARATKLAKEREKAVITAQRKHDQAEYQRCVGNCSVGCSSWRIQDTRSCFLGCVARDCTEVQR